MERKCFCFFTFIRCQLIRLMLQPFFLSFLFLFIRLLPRVCKGSTFKSVNVGNRGMRRYLIVHFHLKRFKCDDELYLGKKYSMIILERSWEERFNERRIFNSVLFFYQSFKRKKVVG